MSRIRLEWVPIQIYGLGLLGFDHLQITYEQFDMTAQDEWFVLEGIRGNLMLEAGGLGGQVTLAEANPNSAGEAQYGQDLINAIGSPWTRGSRALPVLDTFSAWVTMAELAADFDGEFHYSILGVPGTVRPTSNSSSLVASLLHYIGIDISNHIPYGMRRTSGMHTLLGTRSDDTMSTTENFSTLQSGRGNDILSGMDASERFYGGRGDDLINWNKGYNLIHGGQWRVAYAEDGVDTVDYTGGGTIIVQKSLIRVENAAPDYVVRVSGGAVDHLYSIERIQWSATSDTLQLEDVEVLEDGLLFKLGAEDTPQGDKVDFAALQHGILINPTGNDSQLLLQAVDAADPTKASWIDSAEWLVGSAHADEIYLDANVRVADGGNGDDLIDARLATAFEGSSPGGYDAELMGGDGNDTLVANAGRMLLSGGAGADTFVLTATTELAGSIEIVIDGADSTDRLYIPYAFFDGSNGAYEGSELMPVLGGIGEPGQLGQSVWSYFDWLLESQRWLGTDMTQGVITFVGSILFDLDGDDLLVHVYRGETVDFEIDDGNGGTYTLTEVLPRVETETIVRVKDFQEGQLGIEFHDPGVAQSLQLPDGSFVLHYPNYDSIVQTLTNNGVRQAPLETRPDAPAPPPGNGEDPEELIGGEGNDTLDYAGGPARAQAGGGDDIVTTGGGDDMIDGGTGQDSMAGGSGSDSYVVDDAADVVTEMPGGGSDTIYSSIDLTMPVNVETLILGDDAISATGNAADNTIGGSELDNVLSGGAGNDLLVGSVGRDTLIGGDGNDSYGYTTGDGIDTIDDQGLGTDVDVLLLNHGIAPTDVTFVRPQGASQDLLLLLADGGRIYLSGFSVSPAHSIDEIVFGDRTHWDRADLEAFAAAAPVETNAAPTAEDDPYLAVTLPQVTIPAATLIANDFDVNGDTLTIIAVDNAVNCTVSLDINGDIALSSDAGYQGLASFTYTVSDGHGGTATAIVEVGVSGTEPTGTHIGTFGDDVLIGTTSDDDFNGLSGNDTMTGGGGADNFDGGAGTDWVSYADATAGASLYLDNSFANMGEAEGDTYASIEGVIGSPFNDDLTATNATTELRGEGGDDNLFSYDGDDTLLGGDGSDGLTSGDGDDTLVGGDDIDSLHGDAGDDVLDGFSGEPTPVHDELTGGTGNDTYITGGDEQLLEVAGEGTDTLLARTSFTLAAGHDIEILRADSAATTELIGNDLGQLLANNPGAAAQLVGGGGADTIEGGAADELLYGDFAGGSGPGSAGADLIRGGDGSDTAYGEAGSDTLLGEAGNDLLYGGSEGDLIDGGGDNDSIYGDAGSDTLLGAAGNDLLSGGGEADTLDAGDGSDTLQGEAGSDTLQGGAGNDLLYGGGEGDLIDAGDGNDTSHGGAGSDTLLGALGGDRLYGGNEGDRVEGGDGNDTVSGDAGSDTLLGEAGDDLVNGGADNDVIEAGAGNDTANGDSGNDTLTGGEGGDVMDGGDGNDRLDGVTDETTTTRDTLTGGLGDDSYVVHGDDVVVEVAGGGIDEILARSTYTLPQGDDVEVLIADVSGIVVTGNELAQWMNMTSGIVAELRGGGGNDSINGSATGNDILRGDFGGGTGPGAAGDDEILGGGGNDSLYGEAGNDYLGGELGNDRLYGDTGNDSLDGGNGGDAIYGEAGDDLLWGQAGTDMLSGGAGNDTLLGGDGIDNLWGEAGNDEITGGAGVDNFMFRAGFGRDILLDRVAGEILDVRGFGANYADIVFTAGAQGLEISSAKFGSGNVIVLANVTGTLDAAQFLF